MLTIQGTLTLSTPMHCAQALGEWGINNQGYPVQNKTSKDMPLTRTSRLSIIGENGKPEEIPYFPANDFRGRLRRNAAEIIFEELKSRDETININTFVGMKSGNWHQQPDTIEPSLAEVNAFRENLFLGVFGGGPKTLPSGFKADDLIPLIKATSHLGAYPQTIQDELMDIFPSNLFEYFSCTHVDDIATFRDVRAGDFVTNYFDAVNEYQDGIDENKKARKAAKKDKAEGKDAETVKKTSIANMFAFESVRAGTPFYMRLTMNDHLRDAQIGLILEALCRFSNNENLGGLVRWGMGRYKLNLALYEDGIRQKDVLSYDMASGEHVLSDDIAEYLDALAESLEQVEAGDMEKFYVYGKAA